VWHTLCHFSGTLALTILTRRPVLCRTVNIAHGDLVVEDVEDILSRRHGHEIAAVPRVTSHVRQDDTVRNGNQRMICGKWLRFCDVKSRSEYLTGSQRVVEIVVVYDSTAAAVDKYCILFHDRECFLVEPVASLRGKVAAYTDDVAFTSHRFKIDERRADIVSVADLTDVMVDNVFDSERLQTTSNSIS